MAKTGPSCLRPLTLRSLTAPARAYQKSQSTSAFKKTGYLGLLNPHQ
ncbi:hypothetical protein HMPREF0539_2143 [Lacticaseibacillus rhamnosus LMS2-1]|uniref:Uncharacterized protein n=1 Tax=Lacticaseibacillus rhamnosus (strain LMS2-1) TaxID=525361 RepID=C2JZ08_LACRM|nr:hypothetical protein LRHK_2324 [Lacticaseibacillus rhamnosus ATCC 8530]EEN79728.1 hypothetical protein HMPREF0539_2143 [Lacticaseibacillus rhamnosus LMS2-1]